MMLELNQENVEWRPPINRTVASKDEGITEVVDSIEEHKKFLMQTGKIETIRANRIKSEVTAMVNDRISRYVDAKVVATEEFAKTITRLQNREIDPYSVVDKIVDSVLR